MAVFTGTFFVLEGATMEGAETLAVCFEEKEMLAFVLEKMVGHEKYIGFRISVCGGLLPAEVVAAPTHEGSAQAN